MKLKVIIHDVYSGGTDIVTLNEHTAHELSLFPGDRIRVSAKGKYTIAVLDISKKLGRKEIGVLGEVTDKLDLNEGEIIDVEPEKIPESLMYIKKKLNNKKLTKDEIFSIVNDIVDNNLTEAEIAYFISGAYTNGFSMEETENLTKAMALSGEIVRWRSKPILDKHCIGGVPGNRTTPIIVPILASAGILIPKTSSRAITSPAGTADTMEVLTNVKVKDGNEIKEIVQKTGACMVWGGSLNIAPADDKIIRIERTLSLDPTPMLLSSIMAKKYAIGATHVLIDIPYGPFGKVNTVSRFKELSKKFKELGRRLGIYVEIVKTPAKEPIGNGLGPALEARDILWILENDERGPIDLKEKSLDLAGKLLEIGNITKKGRELAEEILSSGKALKKMKQIIEAQGGDPEITSKDIKIGQYSYNFRAEKSGKIYLINDHGLSISRLAGTPKDKGAGIYLHVKLGNKVEEGDPLFTIYAESRRKLDEAVRYAIDNFPIIIK